MEAIPVRAEPIAKDEEEKKEVVKTKKEIRVINNFDTKNLPKTVRSYQNILNF